MPTPDELFQAAYKAHHKQRDPSAARVGYERILAEHPDSPEAGYARTQLDNLVRDDVALQKKRDAQSSANSSHPGSDKILLTTAPSVEGQRVERTIDILAVEAIVGVNVLRDMLASVRDIVGGRSGAMQNALRAARQQCLTDLRREAVACGANAVIACAFNYSEISGDGKSMLLFSVSGTAVWLTESPVSGVAE